MKKLLLLIIPFIVFSCNTPCKEKDADKNTETISYADSIRAYEIKRDLPEIKKDGVLKAITLYSSTSYFIYRGKPMGFDYELLTRLAEHLNLKLEIVVADDVDELINMLIRGDGDMIAYALTITDNRRKVIDFTKHHAKTHQVLVQKKPDHWRKMKLHEIDRALLSDALDLIGDTVWVRRNSSYYERMINLMHEIGDTIHIEILPGDIDTEEIIEEVSKGKIKYTISDYNIASIMSSYFDDIDIRVPVSMSQRLAWAVRKSSPELKTAINEWITKMKKTDDYYIIYHKYFESRKKFKTLRKSKYFSKETGRISPYDKIIKKYSAKVGWDWRLVSSIVYQESRFDINSKSWTGACGLMQLMPATAKAMGIKNPKDPDQNIRGGIKYLKHLFDQWPSIPDTLQRIKFTLASYNCGINHVVDAQNLTKKYGGDPDLWDNNVENYLKLLSKPKYYNDPVVKFGYVRGIEPYKYVKEIFERYYLYKDVIPE
jgi:membrane-bound lytic murein transglycosylase F